MHQILRIFLLACKTRPHFVLIETKRFGFSIFSERPYRICYIKPKTPDPLKWCRENPRPRRISLLNSPPGQFPLGEFPCYQIPTRGIYTWWISPSKFPPGGFQHRKFSLSEYALAKYSWWYVQTSDYICRHCMLVDGFWT